MVKDTHSFFLFLIINIQIPNQVVESFFYSKSCNYNYKKRKRIWDRIRLYYVGTTFGIEFGAFTSMPTLNSTYVKFQCGGTEKPP